MQADDATALLRSQRLRVTPQRLAILQAFRRQPDEHLSAEDVMSRAGQVVPAISRGTVYATLAELSELGLIVSVGQAEAVRFETNLTAHDHFRCRLCQRLFDIDLGGEQPRRRLDGHSIESVTSRAEGVCRDCRAYERGLIDGAAHIRETPLVSTAQAEELACLRIDAPVGELLLGCSSTGVVRVAFAGHADFDTLAERARSRRGARQARTLSRDLGQTLEAYFAGDADPLPAAIDWRHGGEAEALRTARQIPYGTQRSYTALVSEMTAYDLGHLMGRNPVPIVVPCHRVARGSERPEVYVGGTSALHVLRALEAV